jgi:hypothetical protein
LSVPTEYSESIEHVQSNSFINGHTSLG